MLPGAVSCPPRLMILLLRPTSIAGVNQRSRKRVQAEKSLLPSVVSRNAVSERFISAAIFCRVSSDSGNAAGGNSTTAAGLPPNAAAVKASICKVPAG